MLRKSHYTDLLRWAGIFILVAWLSLHPAQAVILYNLDNSANTTDPLNGSPWGSVATITNSTGTTIAPSSVYIGNGYMLTANHVDISPGYVTFDGTTTYAIDTTFTPVQVGTGVDMKVFKLQVNPSVAAVNLLSTATETSDPAYLIGWGVGRGATALGSADVAWGDDSTTAKRWGTNEIKVSEIISYSGSGGPYSYIALATYLGTPVGGGLGDTEAALTDKDSGSGLFQNIGGTWYLVGLSTATETSGTSHFGNDPQTSTQNGDVNAFVRVSSYYSDIIAAVPEPETYALMALGLGFLGFAVRVQRLRQKQN